MAKRFLCVCVCVGGQASCPLSPAGGQLDPAERLSTYRDQPSRGAQAAIQGHGHAWGRGGEVSYSAALAPPSSAPSLEGPSQPIAELGPLHKAGIPCPSSGSVQSPGFRPPLSTQLSQVCRLWWALQPVGVSGDPPAANLGPRGTCVPFFLHTGGPARKD